MEQLAIETAEMIADYDKAAAKAYLAQPFNRVALAQAFARGFAKNANDDIHPVASLVLRSAMLDKESRKLSA